jgi:hypothetical protein
MPFGTRVQWACVVLWLLFALGMLFLEVRDALTPLG